MRAVWVIGLTLESTLERPVTVYGNKFQLEFVWPLSTGNGKV